MIGVLILMSSISIGLRLLPHIFSSLIKKMKAFEYISKLLPAALIMLLVVHCLLANGYGLFDIGAIGVVIISQIVTRNVLASMLIGVAAHQLLYLLV